MSFKWLKDPVAGLKVVNITKEMLLSDVWKRDWKATFPVDRSEPINFCKSKEGTARFSFGSLPTKGLAIKESTEGISVPF